MPRRRKSLHSNKAPLIFTESPVNKQSNVPSPVYCARHPRTAQSVPVDEMHDLTWVSPQFSSTHGSSRKVRKPRKRRSTSGPKCTCHCGGSDKTATPKGNTKFKPLKFVGEKTPPVTILEDLSFSSEDGTEKISLHSKSPCLNRAELTVGRKSRTRSRKSLSNSQKHSKDLDQSANTRGDSDDSFDLKNNSVRTPKTTNISRHSKKTRLQDDIDNECNQNLSQASSSPVKRLFTSVSNSPETNVFTLIRNRRSGKRNKIPSAKLLKDLYSSVCSSPSANNVNNARVLVADTPESDYGIPYRLRRLRKLRKNVDS